MVMSPSIRDSRAHPARLGVVMTHVPRARRHGSRADRVLWRTGRRRWVEPRRSSRRGCRPDRRQRRRQDHDRRVPAGPAGRGHRSSTGQAFAPYFAPICSVRGRSSPSGVGRESRIPASTYRDEPRRTVVDERSALAKVGVAGSNPVVRSRKRVSDLRVLFSGRALRQCGQEGG